MPVRCIQREVHSLTIQAGLDCADDFKNQPAAQLGLVYKLAREMFPVLERFPNDWATAEMVKQYLYNKRKNSVKKGYIPPREERLKKARAQCHRAVKTAKIAKVAAKKARREFALANKENMVGAAQDAANEDAMDEDEDEDEEGEN